MSKIDQITITPEVYKKWHELCRDIALDLQRSGYSLDDIGYEDFYIDEKGQGLIFVETPKGTISLALGDDEWGWHVSN